MGSNTGSVTGSKMGVTRVQLLSCNDAILLLANTQHFSPQTNAATLCTEYCNSVNLLMRNGLCRVVLNAAVLLLIPLAIVAISAMLAKQQCKVQNAEQVEEFEVTNTITPTTWSEADEQLFPKKQKGQWLCLNSAWEPWDDCDNKKCTRKRTRQVDLHRIFAKAKRFLQLH